MLITTHTITSIEHATQTFTVAPELETALPIPAAELETEILTHQPKRKRLVSHWEMVDGHLACVWGTELD